jgi:hypothetical protein
VSRQAFKFLLPGAVGPFTGFGWPTGAWVDAEGPLDPCVCGVHGVAREHLVRWLQPELWRIELAGDRLETDGVIVAERGRLLERVEGWNLDTARELMEDCVARGHELARAHPDSELLAGLAEQAPGYLDGTFEPDDAFQAVATGTYVVARAAGSAASTDDPVAHEAGFDAERRRQSLWLADRLGLEAA